MEFRTRREELMFTAGVIDSEGCVSLIKDQGKSKKYQKSPNYRASLRIQMTDLTILNLIKSITNAGHITPIVHKGNRIHYKPAWDWHCGHKDTIRFLKEIHPFLIVKKKQAELVLEYETLPKMRGGQGKYVPTGILSRREEIFLKVKHLKTI